MRDMFDMALGESAEESVYPGKRKGSKQPRSPRDLPAAPRASQQKPAEVSDNVWGLAEHFLEAGKAFFGRHIPVNRAEFSKRLSETINTDRDVVNLLRPWEWDDDHKYLHRTPLTEPALGRAILWINDVVAEMIDLFWNRLEQGAANSGSLQFRFLDDDWAALWYDAVTNLEVRKIHKGLETGETKRVPANYRMVSEESQAAHRMKRLQIRLRNQEDKPERAPLTDEERAEFADWVAERNRTRDSVAP